MTDSRYWRSNGVEFLRWDASTHRYARHSHEGYAIGVVARGAHAFTARGRRWTARPGCVIVVNPEDAHDGGPAGRNGGYSYRMMYVDPTVIAADSAPFFRESVVEDGALARRLFEMHEALERPEAQLECETLLLTALDELARRHGGARPSVARRLPAVSVALEYLTAHFAEECSLSDLAALTGIDRFQLLRAFQRQVGLPPHRYQTQLRLRLAKQLIAEGQSAASVAATVGFSDQSHLIRKFKAAYGVTPGAITFNPRQRV